MVISDVPDSPVSGSIFTQTTAPLKELRRRDCARRHWRPYRCHA